MKFLDLVHMNIDIQYAEKLDTVFPKAIKYLDLICEALQKLNRDVTAQSAFHVISDQTAFIDLVKSIFFDDPSSDLSEGFREILNTYSIDDQFCMLRFYGVFIGVIRYVLPKTSYTATLPNLDDVFYLGHTQSKSEPYYIPLVKGESFIIQHNVDTISNSFLQDFLLHKFNCGHGFILIDSTKNQECLKSLRKNSVIFEREKDLIICNKNFDFDVKQAILDKKIVYVHLPVSKAASEKADQFAQQLQNALSEIDQGVEPYSLFAFYCDGLISENWKTALGDLEQYNQALNCFYMSPTMINLPDNLFEPSAHQILTDMTTATSLSKHPRYSQFTNLEYNLFNKQPYGALYIHNGILTEYSRHF